MNYKKLIFTIDLDAFFAACEEKRHPEFKKQPIIIGNKMLANRGIVGACNYKAREYGIYTGMPIFKAKSLCHNVQIIESDYEYYVKKSEEVFQSIKKIVKNIEVSSIDECFIEVTNENNSIDPIELAQRIIWHILSETGLNASVGISTNKFLAKMASKMNKPNGLTTLYPFEIETKLWGLPIDKMHYIGNATAKYLVSKNIFTIGDLAKLVNDFDKYTLIKKDLGIRLDGYLSCAWGKTKDDVNVSNHYLKSISFSKTYLIDLKTPEQVVDALFLLTKTIILKLQYRAMFAKTISLQTKPNGALKPTRTLQKTLDFPSDDLNDFWPLLMKLFDEWYQDQDVRFLAVSVSNLENRVFRYRQLTLDDLNDESYKKHLNNKENLLINDLNLIVGYEALFTMEQFEKIKRFSDKSLNQNDRVKFKRWDKY